MANVAGTALERALAIFELFQRVKEPLSLTRIADEIGMPKSSCRRQNSGF